MRRHRHTNTEADVDMTPMLDIVFIMLIFFIVTASFTREPGLDVTRPDSNEDQPKSEAESILIAINNTDVVTIWEKDPSGQIVERRIDVRAVRANVERRVAESPKSAVVVQPHPDASLGVLVQVMDQARMANAPVSIAETN